MRAVGTPKTQTNRMLYMDSEGLEGELKRPGDGGIVFFLFFHCL